MMQARQVWATLQSNRRERLNERDYLIVFAQPPTPEEYRAKANRMYAAQNKALERRK